MFFEDSLFYSEVEIIKARGLVIFVEGCRMYPGGDIIVGEQNKDKERLAWGLEVVQQRLEGIHVLCELQVLSC